MFGRFQLLEGIRSSAEFFTSLSVALPILSVVAMAMLAFYVWNRTQSSYSLLDRLWQLLHGNKDCKDREISDFLDEQFALMQFRFTTGIPARTRKHATAVIDWARKHNEDVGAVAACGQYFDFEKIKLKEKDALPKRWHLFCRFLVTLILLFVTFAFLSGAFTDRALLQLKSSDVYFTLSLNDAKPIGYGAGLTLKQCASGEVLTASGFEKKDAEIICSFFKDGSLDSYLKKVVNVQRIVFSVGSFFVAWVFWIVLSWLLQGVRAVNMSNRVNGVVGLVEFSLMDGDL